MIHDLTFDCTHLINCVCHSIMSMFRVLEIYNFGLSLHVVRRILSKCDLVLTLLGFYLLCGMLLRCSFLSSIFASAHSTTGFRGHSKVTSTGKGGKIGIKREGGHSASKWWLKWRFSQNGI